MIGFLTASVLVASLYAAIAGNVIGAVVGKITGNKLLQSISVFSTSSIIAYYMVSGLAAVFTVVLAPLWVVILLVLIMSIPMDILARKGYLGNKAMWMKEIDKSNKYVRASLELLTQKDIERVVKYSADSEDFQNNLIRAAGLDDHKIPEDI